MRGSIYRPFKKKRGARAANRRSVTKKKRGAVVSSGLSSKRNKSGEAPKGPDGFCGVGELSPRREQAQRDKEEVRSRREQAQRGSRTARGRIFGNLCNSPLTSML